MKTFDIQLDHGFQYHFKGELVTAKFITISAFTMKHLDKVTPVKEIAIKAIMAMAKSADDEEKELIEEAKKEQESQQEDSEDNQSTIVEASGLMRLLYAHCQDGDMPKLIGHMKKLLTCGICSIDGESPFNGSHIDDLNPGDFEKLCGEYIGNFITS